MTRAISQMFDFAAQFRQKKFTTLFSPPARKKDVAATAQQQHQQLFPPRPGLKDF